MAGRRTHGGLPPDGDHLTHIERINPWDGSDSYVEGAGSSRNPAPYDPPSPRLPYMLLSKAIDRDGRILKAGQTVELHANEVAAHHARLPDVDYSPHLADAREGNEEPVAEVKTKKKEAPE